MIDSDALVDAIAQASGERSTLVSCEARGGGSISEAFVFELADGRRYFVKTHPRATEYPGLFAAEFAALELLRAAETIRVPAPLVAGETFIVIEAFDEGPRDRVWQQRLGRELAMLHRTTRGANPGFDYDNFIGTTPQPNAPAPDWVSFWRERRLLWQLEHFAAAGNAGDPLLSLGYELAQRLTEIIGEPAEPCVLLHGDLWSGNAAAGTDGAPIIFDPASYYGRREAELGMMQLFGGFDATCFSAYDEVWPLAPDSDRRIAVYRLYHELNHLNLFGRGYYESCVATLRGLL